MFKKVRARRLAHAQRNPPKGVVEHGGGDVNIASDLVPTIGDVSAPGTALGDESNWLN